MQNNKPFTGNKKASLFEFYLRDWIRKIYESVGGIHASAIRHGEFDEKSRLVYEARGAMTVRFQQLDAGLDKLEAKHQRLRTRLSELKAEALRRRKELIDAGVPIVEVEHQRRQVEDRINKFDSQLEDNEQRLNRLRNQRQVEADRMANNFRRWENKLEQHRKKLASEYTLVGFLRGLCRVAGWAVLIYIVLDRIGGNSNRRN